jgi:muramidase (phage lysozyme)
MMFERWSRMGVIAIGLGLAACTAAANDESDDDEGEEDVSTESALSAPTCAATMANGAVPKPHRALLDTIAYAEGTSGRGSDGYNVTYAYRYFASCSRHPNMKVCAGGYCSTAAGRYQFLTKTWNGLGIGAFGPANQDKGAMKLVARRGVTVPANRAMTATELANAMSRISYEWASLPPGRYGQPTRTLAAVRADYCKHVTC